MRDQVADVTAIDRKADFAIGRAKRAMNRIPGTAKLDTAIDRAAGIEADEVAAGFAGPAYGVPDAGTLEAIALAARLEALVLDPVYSGKGMAGLIALIAQGRWTRDDHIVFVHTGGAPALFAYQSALGI